MQHFAGRIIYTLILYVMSYNYSNMHLSFQSLNIPPSGNPRALHRRPCPWGEEFKPCLAGMENLNLNRKRCQVFPAENKSFIFQYGDV